MCGTERRESQHVALREKASWEVLQEISVREAVYSGERLDGGVAGPQWGPGWRWGAAVCEPEIV